MFTSPLRQRPGVALLGLAAGLLSFTPFVARAQTQDLFVTSQASRSILRFAGTGPGTFSTTPTTLANDGSQEGLAFDARGDLFAASTSSQLNSVAEYPVGAVPGTFGTPVTLTDPSIDDPIGLAVDTRGDLFVANQISGTGTGEGRITEFLGGDGAGHVWLSHDTHHSRPEPTPGSGLRHARRPVRL